MNRIATGVLLAGVAVMMGGCAAAEPAPPVTNTVTATATVTASPPPTKFVGVTPSACIDALDKYEQLVTLLKNEQIPLIKESIQGAFDRDAVALQATGEKIEALSTKINAFAIPIGADSKTCRSAAKKQ